MDVGRCPSVVLKECVNLFFSYQRPFCTIVDRDEIEQGLLSPMDDYRQSTYLIHAVCAMGALMSDDRHVRELANPFVASAESKLSETPFWHSRLDRAQTMLLIAVFAAGRGHISKAWIYSGMAIRITQDLGIDDIWSLSAGQGPQSALSTVVEKRQRMSLTFTISDKSLQP
ncbi:uncharacterized protein HMPREF1541_01410 [Cyphellophora europaea CBS 101466]|uniref:Xylanolytic transcriptional activator regulatory domain-containing protein n=1 Tax=Cyphellophora europaea (strain CBS 101466) TaxID=1220924 RepID=W2SH75_CYPE1|nr:uncharacterized protein HMPREF1541_01410 [Cyphellophora europaea CBS 101466]ETN47219.1 hypothetical protein HMPREF1541_01410 [Cyphellophora europaea CBS 101466]